MRYAPPVGPARRVVRVALIATGILPFLAVIAPGSTVSELLAPWFRFQCHGLAERTIALAGRPFPVCSRCLGIYAGLSLAALLMRPLVSPHARRAWLVAAAIAMVAEVVVQDSTGHAPIHALRAATGLALAWPIALMVIAGSAAEEEAAPARRRPNERGPQKRC